MGKIDPETKTLLFEAAAAAGISIDPSLIAEVDWQALEARVNKPATEQDRDFALQFYKSTCQWLAYELRFFKSKCERLEHEARKNAARYFAQTNTQTARNSSPRQS